MSVEPSAYLFGGAAEPLSSDESPGRALKPHASASDDIPMQGFMPLWAVAAQCVVGGIVLGLSALHHVWWRADLHRSGPPWTLFWSVALGLVLISDGVLGLVPADSDALVPLLFVRSQIRAAAVLLALPAVRSYTGGRPVHGYIAVAGALYVTRAVLWLTTDTVFVSFAPGQGPVSGPLSGVTFLLPVAVVAVYVGRTVGRDHITRTGAWLVATGAASAGLLVLAFLVRPSRLAEILLGVWAIPLVVGLQLLARQRIEEAQRDARRQAQMREAIAAIANAAWFLQDPQALLRRAEGETRELLGDPSIEGTLRPLARGRFVTEFYSADGRVPDDRERAFLMDLAQVVSAAAERHTLATRLSKAAYTDSLTRLPNRHALERHLQDTLERANVERTRVAVLYTDLDGFKQANDQHGHAWGDQLLVLASTHLRDTARRGDFVARLGGDEFVVVVERAGSDEELVALGQRLRDGFEVPDSDRPTPTLTVGLAVWEPGEEPDADALVRDADTAMLEGKRTREHVTVFDAALRARALAEVELRRELDLGLAAGEFAVHFQPIVCTDSLQIVEVEALARWTRDGRLRMPCEWLEMAEETGLIVPIGRALLESASVGTDRFGLPVAVNVAARQLAEPRFLDDVAEAWGDRDWRLLTVEITESALLHDAENVHRTLTALRERGARIALDDFGTGYNSLARLATMPIDVLKIDQSFVRDIASPTGEAMLRAILTLADAHGLDVVAEGVERADELTALAALGVPKVQGFFLGRPTATVPIRTPGPIHRLALPV